VEGPLRRAFDYQAIVKAAEQRCGSGGASSGNKKPA
jgi:hypothetical protein